MFLRKTQIKEIKYKIHFKKADQRVEIEYNEHDGSGTESMFNIADGSSESGTSHTDFTIIASDLQINSLTMQTPGSIKKLFVGILIVLLGAIVLISKFLNFHLFIGVEGYVAVTEINYLGNRFDLIKNYEMRSLTVITLGTMAGGYLVNLKQPPLTFNNMIERLSQRVNRICDLNDNTRKFLFSQNINYDLQEIIIPDPYVAVYYVTYSHAMLIVIYKLNYY